jgi:hypothetical protein
MLISKQMDSAAVNKTLLLFAHAAGKPWQRTFSHSKGLFIQDSARMCGIPSLKLYRGYCQVHMNAKYYFVLLSAITFKMLYYKAIDLLGYSFCSTYDVVLYSFIC